MDAIFMPGKLLNKLENDYPDINFQAGSYFKWSAGERVLYYNLSLKNARALLLHELAHVILGHYGFRLDVELIHQEALAWHHAKTELAPRYGVTLIDDELEDAMDSYRQWLHRRSLCPDCCTSSFQTETGVYRCLACRCQWRANDARQHALRRYRLVVSL